MRNYRANNKTIILIGTVFEVEIGTKATKLSRRRTYLLSKFDLGGGEMNMVTINISSVKVHTKEPLRPATDFDGGKRASSDTTNTTVDTNITYPVSIRVFEAPALYPLNDKAFRLVVAQPMEKFPAGISLHRHRMVVQWWGLLYTI